MDRDVEVGVQSGFNERAKYLSTLCPKSRGRNMNVN